ncbi:MAG: hypothetical protein L6244_06205 [Candidatus Methanoperedenaceae archaeon]|nr:hypothetical protein [Candidatus Methanoperedenaceae archaeon]
MTFNKMITQLQNEAWDKVLDEEEMQQLMEKFFLTLVKLRRRTHAASSGA